MKNLNKIKLASLANDEIKKQQLIEVRGGKNMCACRNYSYHNRTQVSRRNATKLSTDLEL